MKLKPLLTSLGCALLLLALYAWPGVRHFSTGISYTSVTADDPPARFMVMGDHLQLLYHVGLMAVGIPYQWTTLFVGSPTGFAMVAVPLAIKGIRARRTE